MQVKYGEVWADIHGAAGERDTDTYTLLTLNEGERIMSVHGLMGNIEPPESYYIISQIQLVTNQRSLAVAGVPPYDNEASFNTCGWKLTYISGIEGLMLDRIMYNFISC